VTWEKSARKGFRSFWVCASRVWLSNFFRNPSPPVCRRGCTVSPEKGGALRNQSTGGRRLGVAAVICGALFGAPLLLLQSASAHSSRSQAATGSAHDVKKSEQHSARPAGVTLPSNLASYQAPTTTSTSAPATTTTTAAPATTTTAPPPPPTTTTTAPPPPPTTTTTTAPPAPAHSEGGEATWYAAAPSGYCASPTLAFGTVLTVVNNATGASTVCTVDDREAAGYPRVVDLSPSGFSQIAGIGQGVVDVTISW
jgi:rare lipoprotein A (peptidoglycan hydrolase)